MGVRLPMQGMRVRAPVREDPTCRGAAGPVRYMAAEPARPEPVLHNGRGHNSERPAYHKKKPTKKPQLTDLQRICPSDIQVFVSAI